MTELALPFTFAQPIATPRLSLRMMTSADVDDVYAYQSREDVARYLLFTPRTHDEVVRRVAEYGAAATLAKDGDFLQVALELPAVDERPIRVIGDIYFALASVEHRRGEIGWTLHPDYGGQGYASEAADAVLALAFETVGLHRVFAELDPRNAASIAMCHRLGMRAEAHFVQDLWFKGGWADTGMYAILAREWRARPARR